MVVERFKSGCTPAIRTRLKRAGRMLPDGVIYHDSWMASTGDRCFQLMEAPSYELLLSWMTQWEDLVEFEVVPVTGASAFWSAFDSSASNAPK